MVRRVFTVFFLTFLLHQFLPAQTSSADIRGIGIAAVGTKYHGTCPVMVHYRATIYATKVPLELEYFWVRSDGTRTSPVRAVLSRKNEPKLNVRDDWAAGRPSEHFSTWNELHVSTGSGVVVSQRAESGGRCFYPAENREHCAAAAANLLKGRIKIVGLGPLGDTREESTFKCLAVLPFGEQPTNDRLLIKRGVILEFRDGKWEPILNIHETVRNQAGHLGIDYIDPSAQFGYAISTGRRRTDNVTRFTLMLTYLNSKRQPEGLPIEISWNPEVGRFQEFAPSEPGEYQSELANPPIRR